MFGSNGFTPTKWARSEAALFIYLFWKMSLNISEVRSLCLQWASRAGRCRLSGVLADIMHYPLRRKRGGKRYKQHDGMMTGREKEEGHPRENLRKKLEIKMQKSHADMKLEFSLLQKILILTQKIL